MVLTRFSLLMQLFAILHVKMGLVYKATRATVVLGTADRLATSKVRLADWSCTTSCQNIFIVIIPKLTLSVGMVRESLFPRPDPTGDVTWQGAASNKISKFTAVRKEYTMYV